MTDDMQQEVDHIETCKYVIEKCCAFMEKADNWCRGVLLWEIEEVKRDEAEAKAKAEVEAEAEAEQIRMRELEEKKDVDGKNEEVAK